MGIDRRELLGLLVGGFLGPLLPTPGRTDANRAYLSAHADALGNYRVSGFSACGDQIFDLPLPARGHSCAVHPRRRVAVLFARRPGTFALAVDFARGAVLGEFATPNDRHFYGHGAFSRDGQLLYTTENDFKRGRGVIGVYDPNHRYRRLGELPSHGIGPHEIQILSDGAALAVANGGIMTRPDLPRVKLNLPTMEPSLCYVDRRDGKLLREHRLERALHQLSIRHLAVGEDDTVAVAMQYEGPAGDLVPLVALCRANQGGDAQCRDDQFCPLDGPPKVVRAMKQYCGSVCFDPTGRVIAVSAPRGHLVTFWDARTGGYLSSVRALDANGVAPGGRLGEFLISSGQGGVGVVSAWSNGARATKTTFMEARRWDNHLVVARSRSSDHSGQG